MTLFLDQLVNGVILGSIYGFVALALVVTHRATGSLNFGQGEMATLSAFISWQLIAIGWSPWLALAGSVMTSFILGAALNVGLMRWLRTESVLIVVGVTLGLFLFFNGLTGFLWGPGTRQMPTLLADKVYTIGPLRLSSVGLAIVLVLTVCSLALYGLFRHTRLGLRMRAVAQNRNSSLLLGIHVDRTHVMAWALSAALGGLAGTLIAPQLFLEPNMMLGVILYAFAAMTLGGVDSPVGAVVGGVIVGVSENLAGTYITPIGSDLKIVVPFLLIVTVLLVRPQGLFGEREAVRV